MEIVTTIRHEVLTLPAAHLGPDNPLPALRPLDEMHRIEDRDKKDLPRDMARQIGYAPLHSLLPVPVRDGYDRDRAPRSLDALVIENDRLRATVLPGLGGRIASLVHKPTGRELLYANPVFQPANFALNGAWFSGGIEWNIGATGHTTLSCSPVHAARVPAPDGGEMLRLWEWERLRDLPFQVDLWLPDGSDFLHVGVRIRNPHERQAPTYWWSNIAVPEDCRVLAPAEEAYHFGYEQRLRRVPVPEYDGVDRTYPRTAPTPPTTSTRSPRRAGAGSPRWTATVTGSCRPPPTPCAAASCSCGAAGPADGAGSSGSPSPAPAATARSRPDSPAPSWSTSAWNRRARCPGWRRTGPSKPGAKGTGAPSWTRRRPGWRACCRARTSTRRTRPGCRTPTPTPASGWPPGPGGARSKCCGPAGSCPARPSTRAPWARSSSPGCICCAPVPFPSRRTAGRPAGRWSPGTGGTCWRRRPRPGSPSTTWASPSGTAATGRRRCAAGRGLAHDGPSWPVLRCLAVADREERHPERAADRYALAFDDLCREAGEAGGGTAGEWTAVVAALGREAIEALLAVGRTADARSVWERLAPATRARGRFRLIEAGLLLAEGRQDEARAVFDAGFEVADLREGDEVIGRLWARLTDEPLPERYDFRMRPTP